MVKHPDLIVGYKSEDCLTESSEETDQGNESNHDVTEALVETEFSDVSWAPENLEAANQLAGSASSNIISSTVSTLFNRSLNSYGNGITIAMVTVAMGFACCENLIYIFIYTQGTPEAG